ncbi:unnamed protein product [Medioppia subpectinata]|uniref:Uncharacterized protein n=1 Tax=Medioppia subpectinata TaxID=1979941 RepID=A0A7R9PWJ6_9ACAR|nr:unnamed protein product [Medioppia subpectinata]CAG2102969.1 unnamed protein product [Medioppia subpectinata]
MIILGDNNTKETNKTYDELPVPSKPKYFPKIFTRLHGVVLTIAWLAINPIAIVLIRYFKRVEILPGTIGLKMHRLFMYANLGLNAFGGLFIYMRIGGWSGRVMQRTFLPCVQLITIYCSLDYRVVKTRRSQLLWLLNVLTNSDSSGRKLRSLQTTVSHSNPDYSPVVATYGPPVAPAAPVRRTRRALSRGNAGVGYTRSRRRRSGRHSRIDANNTGRTRPDRTRIRIGRYGTIQSDDHGNIRDSVGCSTGQSVANIHTSQHTPDHRRADSVGSAGYGRADHIADHIQEVSFAAIPVLTVRMIYGRLLGQDIPGLSLTGHRNIQSY